MRMLLLLLLLIFSLRGQDPHSPFLIIFTSEGTYYKLHINSKHVQWYNSLDFKLIEFKLGQSATGDPPGAFFLPTLDGHFLFVQAQTQILIERNEVQRLLNVCFEGHLHDKKEDNLSEFFIYEKFEYYIINLNNGEALQLQKFLQNGLTARTDRMAVLKISKKYLKQLKHQLTVAWSTISSDIDLIPLSLFLSNPKASTADNNHLLQKSGLEFKRIGNTQIQMKNNQGSFQIGGSSHIVSIFSYTNIKEGFLKHPLNYYQRSSVAALEYKPEQTEFNQIMNQNHFSGQKLIFPHSEQINRNKKNKLHQTDLQYCVSAYRTLRQAITDQSNNSIKKQDFHFHFHKISDLNISQLTPRLQLTQQSPIQVITYGPTDDQPYVWIAILLTTFIGGYLFYRMRINSLLNELSTIESQTGKKLEEFQQRLGKFQQLKKMYEVFWDKLVYKVVGQQWYQHVVFQGKFLNQQTFVYAVRLQGTDIITLEHKLNSLLNFSNKGLAKLYYYTRNSELLLIFTEKVIPLSMRQLPTHLDVHIAYNHKKTIIADIIQSIAYLDQKIQINCVPNEAIGLEPVIQNQPDPHFQFKLNAVPCFLRKSQEDSDIDESKSGSSDMSTFQLRLNMATLFHLILHQGQSFDKSKIDQLLRNQAYSQDEYLQFFDFILYQARSKAQISQKDIENGGVSQNSRQLMFRDILDHPFLWDSKRKILFLSDFSNYIQTHIDQSKVRKLQSHAKDYKVIKTPWIKQFHFLFVKQISSYRKYDFQSVRDLIRVIRNKLNHFHQIPKEIRTHIGKTPQGFIEYCLELFPKLLHFAYIYTRKKKWKLHMK